MTTSAHLPYFNRELSWLNFNARVLSEAMDARNPLLERLKFLAIFSTNLDEFYMVRVAGLRRRVCAGAAQYSSDAMTPAEQLDALRVRVKELLELRRSALRDNLMPALNEHGVGLLTMSQLSKSELATVDQFFEAQVFPVLTPLAVDPGHPFPYISNLSLSLAVEIRDPASGKEHFARVKVPRSLPRFVPVGRGHFVVPLEDVIGAILAHCLREWMCCAGTRFALRVIRISISGRWISPRICWKQLNSRVSAPVWRSRTAGVATWYSRKHSSAVAGGVG